MAWYCVEKFTKHNGINEGAQNPQSLVVFDLGSLVRISETNSLTYFRALYFPGNFGHVGFFFFFDVASETKIFMAINFRIHFKPFRTFLNLFNFWETKHYRMSLSEQILGPRPFPLSHTSIWLYATTDTPFLATLVGPTINKQKRKKGEQNPPSFWFLI